ncbi:hypothetical protein NUSPORA_00230 [Nucleospora cyclopteri]
MKKERIRKAKKAMKILISQGFRNPMQLICDSSFLNSVDKIANGSSVILNYFQEYPKFFIHKCEYNLYVKEKKASEFSGICEIIKCECNENQTCITDEKLITEKNPNHYIFCSTNKNYINRMKKMRIPIFTIQKSVPYFDLGEMKKKKYDIHGKAASSKELKKLNQLLN